MVLDPYRGLGDREVSISSDSYLAFHHRKCHTVEMTEVYTVEEEVERGLYIVLRTLVQENEHIVTISDRIGAYTETVQGAEIIFLSARVSTKI